MKISNKAGAISSNIELWKDIINSPILNLLQGLVMKLKTLDMSS